MEKIVDFIDNNEKYALYPLEDKGDLKSPYVCALSLGITINGFKEVEARSSSKLERVDQDVGIIKVIFWQYVNLGEKFKHKVPLKLLPIKTPPWRDKQKT